MRNILTERLWSRDRDKSFFNKNSNDPIKIIEELNNDYKAKYTLREDGKIDVNGSVILNNKSLKKLSPLKFGKVSGDFYIHKNKLESLEGAPEEVGGNFDCSNNWLRSLVGGPTKVGKDYDCSYNMLTSLEYCPIIINQELSCGDNKLTSFKGAPNIIKGDFTFLRNKLTSLEGCPSKVGGEYIVQKCCADKELEEKIKNAKDWSEIYKNHLLWSSSKLQDMNKKTGIFENTSNNEVEIREELRNYRGSEYFMTAYATINKKYVGHCDYSLYKDEISIKYLFVEEAFRKKGIASKLLDFIKTEYKNKLIDYGYSTDDGAKFMDSYMMSKKKKLLKVGELLHEKGYKLMKERNKEMSIKENLEKDIAIIAFNNKKVEFTNEDCLNLANKYDMFYNEKEQGFIVKIRTLNDLKVLIRNSEDLEIENPEYHIFTDDSRYEADYEEIVKNVDNYNKKKIKYLYNVDLFESPKLPVELINKILKAANDAYNDYINAKIQNVIFEKLYKTKYFKKYSNDVNYKIENGFYILLATPKFLEESVEHQLDYIERNGGKDFATATIFNIFENINEQIFLTESDFDIKLDKAFFNQCLEISLKEKGK